MQWQEKYNSNQSDKVNVVGTIIVIIIIIIMQSELSLITSY